MSPESDVLRRFQSTLKNFSFPRSVSYSEQFARDRFFKKFEEPELGTTDNLAEHCWNDFISFDCDLGFNTPLPGVWYKVRAELHRALSKFHPSSVRFPKGSEFISTRGKNSIQARLESSIWTCTHDNFEQFARITYGHKALKRACKRRYKRWFYRQSFDISKRAADQFLFNRLKEKGDVPFEIFKWKLARIITFTHGSRFATVPKNNDKRRPINIEPFANLICQASLGDFFRRTLKEYYAQDLDSLQDVHRKRIRDLEYATIDLKNASDGISLSLVQFLLPKGVVKLIEQARSEFILGPDRNYYQLKKVSSMGNGFTFELMSLIFTALCRVLDCTSSVYGDDIIIKRDLAPTLISNLTAVGLVVNEDKSFWTGPFRESCGANYHETEGYIRSYDFLWPNSIGDCIQIWNKVVLLAEDYPSFEVLRKSLYRAIPKTLRGGPCSELESLVAFWQRKDSHGNKSEDVSFDLPLYFVTKEPSGSPVTKSMNVYQKLLDLHYVPEDFIVSVAYKWVPDLRTPTRNHLTVRDWAKYEMYLHSNRRSKDVITGRGKWVRHKFLTSGDRQFALSALLKA